MCWANLLFQGFQESLFSVLINLLIIDYYLDYVNHLWDVWCQRIVKNANRNFPKANIQIATDSSQPKPIHYHINYLLIGKIMSRQFTAIQLMD